MFGGLSDSNPDSLQALISNDNVIIIEGIVDLQNIFIMLLSRLQKFNRLQTR